MDIAGEGERSGKCSDPLVELSLDQAGHDAADAVAVAADLRLLHGEPGRFGGEPGLQVEVDGPLEVALALLHRPGLAVLTRLDQPLKIVPPQVLQLRVALGSSTRAGEKLNTAAP